MRILIFIACLSLVSAAAVWDELDYQIQQDEYYKNLQEQRDFMAEKLREEEQAEKAIDEGTESLRRYYYAMHPNALK